MSEVSLSTIAKVNPAIRIPHDLPANDEVSFIPMSDVSESGDWTTQQTRPLRSVTTGFTAFEDGDVLVAKITPCLENGKGAYVRGLRNGIGFGSTEFHVLRAKPGIDPRFVFHVTQSQRFRRAAERQMVGSAGQQRVQRQFFDEFFVREFSSDEQTLIAKILDTLDNTIRATEAIIDKLKIVKQGLLHDLLTRGIDSNGELRPPQSEMPQHYKESPLGWIPKEWEVRLLDSVAVRGSGHTPNKNIASYWNAGIKWVSLADSHNLDKIFIHETDKEVSELGIANSSAVVHPSGTVILSRDAGIGKSAILVGNMAVSQHFMAWRCGEKMNNLFLYFYLQREKPKFESIAIGSTIKTIGLPFFKSYNVVVPPRYEQDQIVAILMTTEQNLTDHSSELDKLKQQKVGLMDDLLTGRVRVTPLLEGATTP
ncbi:MAG: restriction endonuclease subunit S [Pseudomonas sp.]|uniref:restriction endonuclease subunit S n=1 Tax=unclassified Pseudomonas TaxID=196821 RepID=UPI000303CE67|nr:MULTISPECIES: restriction endonuclease subunit S [unclassified Pseudomonas]MDE1193734.1 restriction endonuclease subunit S [Pseudomonas sp.]